MYPKLKFDKALELTPIRLDKGVSLPSLNLKLPTFVNKKMECSVSIE